MPLRPDTLDERERDLAVVDLVDELLPATVLRAVVPIVVDALDFDLRSLGRTTTPHHKTISQ